MPAEPATGTDSGGFGTLIVLGAATDDVSCWLLTGEATGAILLTATGLGLPSCPLAQPLDVPRTRRPIRDTVMDAGVPPQMILRVGYPTTQAEVPVVPHDERWPTCGTPPKTPPSAQGQYVVTITGHARTAVLDGSGNQAGPEVGIVERSAVVSRPPATGTKQISPAT